MPVEETRVPEGGSSMAEITETVSSPPSAQPPVEEQTSPPPPPPPPVPEDDFTNDITDSNDHPDDAKTPVGMMPPAPHNNFYRNNPEKRAASGLPPVESPENKKPKTVEQQHKAAFKTAYDEMTGDEMRGMNQALNRGIDEAFAAANREALKLGREDEKLKDTERKQRENKEREEDIERLKQGPLKLEEPNPDEKVSQAAKKTIKPKKEESNEDEGIRPIMIRGKGITDQTMSAKEAEEKGYTPGVMSRGRKVWVAPEESSESSPIEPKGKATKKGRDAVRAASERLANAGMTGKKSEEPQKPEKAADKKKEKAERKRQDLTGIKKPKDSDLRRSADQQMLADVLLKKIPVADLRMLDRMLGGGVESPVLVDDMGFITQAQAIDPGHVMMAGMSDNPNPFETDMDPRLKFDLSRLKIPPTPTRFPGVPAMNTSRNKLLEEMTFVPTKRVPKLDDKGKKIPTGEKNKFGNPTYEMESVEDEDIGFFIRDGKNKRRMTSKEAAEILDSRKKAKSQPQVKIDLASPYWSENQWNIPITSAGKTSTLPDVFGMMQTSAGADPRTDRDFISDPRTSSLADWSKLKEITSISPADFKRRIKGAKDNQVRIGDAVYQHKYLKDIADSMKPSDMANEDIVLTGMKNAPLFIAGRGVKRYDEEPSYFETVLAPFVEQDPRNNDGDTDWEDRSWESMNDLFE